MNKTLIGIILSTVVGKLKDSEPTTTTAGFILSTLVAAQIDWVKLMNGDGQEIGNLLGAIAILILGYYTNHSKFKQ